MSMDEGEDGPNELGETDLEAIQGGSGVWFGDYSVIAPGVQIVLGGRAISLPNE